ncbi:pentapeptide repeat-containing protein [Chryseobacterium indoltheticum]|uniref:pentapeptide repeat-containing protein n=1 Tax=Chryseobacterium indoltheticum TaxID=254 RepID=UPI003F49983E
MHSIAVMNLEYLSEFVDMYFRNSIFYKTTIKRTLFKNSKLIEVDFAECDLSNSVFSNCDFFSGLQHSKKNQFRKNGFKNFVSLYHQSESNRLKKTKFSLSEIHEALT